MNNPDIFVTNDVFHYQTGKYTCIFDFANTLSTKQKEVFIKTHILSLSYYDLDYVFNPQ